MTLGRLRVRMKKSCWGNQYQGAGVDTGNLMLNPADGTEESGLVTALQLQLALVQAQTTLKEREIQLEREKERERAAHTQRGSGS